MGLIDRIKELFGGKKKEEDEDANRPADRLTIRDISTNINEAKLRRELEESRRREQELQMRIRALETEKMEKERLLEEIKKREMELKKLEEQISALSNEINKLKGQGSAAYTLQLPALKSQALDNLHFGPYTFSNFVVGANNKFVFTAARAVAEAPADAYNPLFIWGGVGLGKTHLMKAIGNYIKEKNPDADVIYTTSEAFSNELIEAVETATLDRFREKYRKADVLIIDDIQFLAGEERTQEEFFHTFNALYDAHSQIIISSDRPPVEIKNLEARLRSRFEGGLITEIKPPDMETRKVILRAEARRRGIVLPEDVIEYIARKVDTNIRTLKGAMNRVVVYCASNGLEPTVDVAREVLKNILRPGSSPDMAPEGVSLKDANRPAVEIAKGATEVKLSPASEKSQMEMDSEVESLANKLKEWRLEGYITTRLDRAMEDYEKDGDLDALREAFSTYERDISRLSALEARLNVIEEDGFEEELKEIRLKMLNPDRVDEIEDDIRLLEEKVRGRKELLLHQKMQELLKKGEMTRAELMTLKNMETRSREENQ